ncbi:unnamed protein product [Phaedon cochleariae]|uniref:Uncharacterized protein n=1 Tax=Phaedon cochleariae TaxID=80249 RepID=A0A9N9X7B6_PHACE|nr:unnamed protein product [Phaedon cochleariae]
MLYSICVVILVTVVVCGDCKELVNLDGIRTGQLISLQQGIEATPGVYLYNPTTNPEISPVRDREVEQLEETTTGKKSGPEMNGKSIEVAGVEKTGAYYIYHPNGLLQKVGYSTKDDVLNMSFMARLRYTNVEAIDGPIYTYDPQSYVFRKL